jgi:hypothetical protein
VADEKAEMRKIKEEKEKKLKAKKEEEKKRQERKAAIEAKEGAKDGKNPIGKPVSKPAPNPVVAPRKSVKVVNKALTLKESKEFEIPREKRNALKEMENLKVQMNEQSKYQGKDRLKRPPTFSWSPKIIEYGTRLADIANHFEIPPQTVENIELAEEDSVNKDISQLKVMAVTLNLEGNNLTHNKFEEVFQLTNAPADIYVIGTQEAEHSIPMSVTFNNSKKKLNLAIRKYFNASDDTIEANRSCLSDNLKNCE